MQKSAEPNLLEMWLHICGESEVPQAYWYWSFVSAVAACVGDRVGIRPLGFDSWRCPNVYVLMVGPSASGKGTAIKKITKLLWPLAAEIGLFNGEATAQAVMDMIGQKAGSDNEARGVKKSARIWLVSEELSLCTGTNEQADKLVRFTTGLYDGDIPAWMQSTRTHGIVSLYNPCVNWLAGTTPDWIHDTISQQAVHSGFVARLCGVVGGRRVFQLCSCRHSRSDHRTVSNDSASVTWLECDAKGCGCKQYTKLFFQRPEIPADAPDVRKTIYKRLCRLTRLRGEFKITNAAKRAEEQWLISRLEEPEDAMSPWWDRAQELHHKLMMIFSLMDGERLVVTSRHALLAQLALAELAVKIPELITMAVAGHAGADAKRLMIVERAIHKATRITRSALINTSSNSGLSARHVDEALNTLYQMGAVEQQETNSGGMIYKWTGR